MIQVLLKKVEEEPCELSSLEQVAFIREMRKISEEDEPPIEQICAKTNLISYL